MKKQIQITAGRGPAECCWVVAQVLKVMLNEARSEGLGVHVLHKESGEMNRTIRSALIQIDGSEEKIRAYLKNWLGTIQWIGKSNFRKYHKRKNWFIGVNELSMKDGHANLKESDMKIEAIRSSGPGGQHANKVSTDVRATHIPTGITVLSSDTRSQIQNKKKAISRLKEKLQLIQVEKDIAKAQDSWEQHDQLQRGNPVRVFRGSDFKTQSKEKKNRNSRAKDRNDLRNYDISD